MSLRGLAYRIWPLATLLLTGCAGYQVGSMLPPDIRSVHVAAVRNATSEPLLENELSRAVLAELQRDGSLAIEGVKTADAILYVEIVEHEIVPISFAADNRALADEFRLILRARIELVRRADGRSLNRAGPLTGRSTFAFSGDLTSAKRTGLPQASADLARHIVSTITESWPEDPPPRP